MSQKSRFAEVHEVLSMYEPCRTTDDITTESTNAQPSTQVGGTHYTSMVIQPIDFIMKNGLSFAEGNVVKYVSRWRQKGGLEDLKKARQYLDFLIQQHFPGNGTEKP